MSTERTAESDALPFACCVHCECRAGERIGHDDSCSICQRPDGTPMEVQ
jgi:hypothetical protein